MASSSSSTAFSTMKWRASSAPARRSAGIILVVVVGLRPSLSQITAFLHPHQVDDALEGLLGAHRQLNRHRLDAQPVADRLDALFEIGADLVHLVDEDDPWHVVAICLDARPVLGLGLHALVAIDARRRSRRAHAGRRSTSMVKSTWPGVSMMLCRVPSQMAVVAAEVMVIPRSCSCSIQSMVAAPSCTSPILWLLPV